jgi:outer membrane protein
MERKLITILLNGIACCFFVTADAQRFSMAKCMEYAVEHNPELALKGSRVSTAEWERKAVKTIFFPKLQGSAALDHYWQIPVQVFPGQLLGQPEGSYIPVRLGTPWNGSYGVDASLDLVDASAWQQLRLKALQAQLVSSEWSSLKKLLLKNVQIAFLSVQLSHLNAVSVAQQYQEYMESHRLISLQFEKGLTDKIAVNQSANVVRNLDEAVIRSKSEAVLALYDLKFWMGYPMTDSISIDHNERFSFEGAVATSFDPQLLPDDGAYLLKSDIVRQQYNSIRSGWYPKLSLRTGYSRLGFGQKIDFLGNSTWFSSGFVGLKLVIPILDLNKMLYEPKREKMILRTTELERLRYHEDQRRVWAIQETMLKQALRSIALQEESLAAAHENRQLSKMKLESGIINVIELKQIEDELSQVLSRLNSAKLEYLKHYIELHHLQND